MVVIVIIAFAICWTPLQVRKNISIILVDLDFVETDIHMHTFDTRYYMVIWR